MDNREIEARLNEIARLLELKGENPFKVRAYQNGARVVASMQDDVATLVKEGALKGVKGIGKGLQEKLEELVETGELTYLDELREGVPPGLFDVLEVPGLGPKKVKALWDTLDVVDLQGLRRVCESGEVAKLKGFGAKTQENIVKGIAALERIGGRRLRGDALEPAATLRALLEQVPGVERVQVGGSLRRGRETVKDVDLLVASRDPEPVMAAVRDFAQVGEVIGSGGTKTSVRLKSGLQVDVRVVEPESFACALAYFTGSKEFNVALRGLALDKGYSLNEYHLNPLDGSEPPAIDSEEALFALLGLAYVPPELRENTGEVEAAQRGALPPLLEPEDVQGILHVHTRWSDGADTVEDLVARAAELGYGYIGISDHSRAAHYANGIGPEELLQQADEVAAARAAHPEIRVLHGIECDILGDGSLDLPDDCLASLDFVIASVHSELNMDADAMTARLVKAVSHPQVDVLGHPTNRKLPKREPSSFDWEPVLDAAAKHGVAIEVNGHPRRLDCDWVHIRRVIKRGVKLCVNPDAHSVDALDDARRFAVTEARRGWATAADVLNTLPADAFVAALGSPG
ncbi:MAG: DNA polymerase/3'-5' exonuclease PolX [Planctomycetes bacterium]|nr:DNA polymerase/3'-5' exonuclease PolX [Planctomycetota bacterium]